MLFEPAIFLSPGGWIQQLVPGHRPPGFVVKVVGEGMKEFENVNIFEPHKVRVYGHFSRQPHALLALLGSVALSRTHRSPRRLHGVVAAFTLRLLFHFHAGS